MTRNRALQFIDDVSGYSTTGCVLEAMEKTLSNIRVEFFCMQFLQTPKQNFADVLLASKVPSDWLHLYIANGFADRDPSQR
jgi:hypothetical protein